MSENNGNHQKRCFVVMGFGIKTDYATGRKLDLNKSYRLLIKPVVEAKGLECVRADEICHSGLIDVPMYQELLKADVVVADLSTANANAFYELGIRHALRPYTTIVVSEDKLPYPFDLNHIKITSYTHLGDAIDFDEVERFRKVLGETLEDVLNGEHTDSPVYTYLNQLVPPSLKEQAAKVAGDIEDALSEAGKTKNPDDNPAQGPDTKNQTLAILTDQAEQAMKNKEFLEAKALFNSALKITRSHSDNNIAGNNSYLVHRLVLATYKAEQPDEISALKEANALLRLLDIENTNDPETVALAGAIEKRLFEKGEGDEHLDNAISLYERGFNLRYDRYNGINLAFMFNCRSNSSLDSTTEDKIADIIWANRIRREILALCEKELEDMSKRENRTAKRTLRLDNDLSDSDISCATEQKFWMFANKAEALFGLGEFEEYKKARQEALDTKHEDWMINALDTQIDKLQKLLEKHGHLLNPPWPKAALQSASAVVAV